MLEGGERNPVQETTILRPKLINCGNRYVSLHGRCMDRLLRFT